METTSENKTERHIVIGILAHVDAGKTTLSEGLLYAGGMIRQRGRVDKQDAHLDTFVYERERGITIFSKQAVIRLPKLTITLLDTPGHVDFSLEMERTLQVLDYAILVISGADGVQGHTRTLWNLLKEYQIPVFLFVNKMDQPGADMQKRMEELKNQLSDNCVSFTDIKKEEFWEEAAMCSEEALEEYLEKGSLKDELICRMAAERKIFPCYFGSALKHIGVEEFLQGICNYVLQKEYPEEFGAKVFKVARDDAGTRLTYLKVTGGSLKVRMPVCEGKSGIEEKISQIRIYSGAKYETRNEAASGEICAVTGPGKTYPGQGLGREMSFVGSLLEPILTYRMVLPEGCDALQMLPKFGQLEEEEPGFHFVWNELHQEMMVRLMGEVQTEILQRQILDRFGAEIGFDTGHILYKETICDTVEGVGHFEPLRHYAEVHLLMEPGERGSGFCCVSDCSEDVLDKNWQRLILTHLKEKEHIGVLTGSAITDIKITLVSGKAHQKHTEGGDFRQAVYRAVRQGLKQADSMLLEPYYEYRLNVPEEFVGRAMTDIEMRHGTVKAPEIANGVAVFSGRAPAACMQEYAKEVYAYTKGCGSFSVSYGGYDICHNADEVIAQIGYDSDSDVDNPSSSVFCSHGAGYLVEWDRVPEFMHLESILPARRKQEETEENTFAQERLESEKWLATEEVDAILARTLEANKRQKSAPKRSYKTCRRTVLSQTADTSYHRVKKEVPQEEYLLVDGYNIIFAWEELRELSKTNIDGARGRLLDLLCNYQGMKKCHLIAVFDAYRVAGHKTEIFDYHNIHVVFTKEAETADAYIEKFAHANGKKYRITVATSDGLEQIIIRGAGCFLLSAADLRREIRQMEQEIKEGNLVSAKGGRSYLMDHVSEEVREQIQAVFNEKESEETI